MGELKVFCERLRELRLKSELPLRSFAESLGMTAISFSALESGTEEPTLLTAMQIARKYGITIDWLCGMDRPSERLFFGDVLSTFIHWCRSEYCRVSIEEKSSDEAEVPQKYVSVEMHDAGLTDFIEKWIQTKQLCDAGVIDNDLYNLWIERHFRQNGNQFAVFFKRHRSPSDAGS